MNMNEAKTFKEFESVLDTEFDGSIKKMLESMANEKPAEKCIGGLLLSMESGVNFTNNDIEFTLAIIGKALIEKKKKAEEVLELIKINVEKDDFLKIQVNRLEELIKNL